ncbi:hypothetical protein N431DRAFT_534580 [Stipitochalara longipes BDJ]|nr:hypothetical protein N431DRAFT_534580 [Stipitochalara longipes BDJ]
MPSLVARVSYRVEEVESHLTLLTHLLKVSPVASTQEILSGDHFSRGSTQDLESDGDPVPDEYITVAGREWIENVFGNGGILAGWMEDISRRTSRVPATFPQDWNELRNSVLTIDASIQQRLARMEIISQQIALIQGLLNELNVRQEEYGTAVQVIDRNLNTITEHGRALTAEQANTFNIVNQIYVDLQAQRITMQGLSDHVGHLAPRHTSIPQPAVNTADVDVGGQPRVVERSSGNELVGILAAVVLVLVIAVIKWFETKQVD